MGFTFSSSWRVRNFEAAGRFSPQFLLEARRGRWPPMAAARYHIRNGWAPPMDGGRRALDGLGRTGCLMHLVLKRCATLAAAVISEWRYFRWRQPSIPAATRASGCRRYIIHAHASRIQRARKASRLYRLYADDILWPPSHSREHQALAISARRRFRRFRLRSPHPADAPYSHRQQAAMPLDNITAQRAIRLCSRHYFLRAPGSRTL